MGKGIRWKKRQGFTLVELLIAIAIIGLLAAVAVPNFYAFRVKGYKAQVISDVRNAYTVATAYYADNPDATALTLANLQATGFRSSPPVILTVTSGSINTFSLTGASSNLEGTYRIDASGVITDNLAP